MKASSGAQNGLAAKKAALIYYGLIPLTLLVLAGILPGFFTNTGLSPDSMPSVEIAWPLPLNKLLRNHPLYAQYLENERKIKSLLASLREPAVAFSREVLREIQGNLLEQDEMLRQYVVEYTAAEKKFIEAEWNFYTEEEQREYQRRLNEINARYQTELDLASDAVRRAEEETIRDSLAKLDRAYGAVILQLNLNIALCAATEDARNQLRNEKNRLIQEWQAQRKALQVKLEYERDLKLREYAAKFQNDLDEEKRVLMGEIDRSMGMARDRSVQKGMERINAQNEAGKTIMGHKERISVYHKDNRWITEVILALRVRQSRIYRYMIRDIESQFKKYGYQRLKKMAGEK
ncbi:MAG: hypothetical protein ACM3WV_00780 [Bacillota bacterium]